MAWILADIKSLIPGGAPKLSEFPKLGDPAPSSNLSISNPAIILFVRHLGCPFCEREIRTAAKLSPDHPSIHFYVITHGTAQDNTEYINNTLKITVPPNMQLIADPTREIYGAYGIGEMTLGQIFDWGALQEVFKLKEEGIKNTNTIGTRYQNSGGFAIDKQGKIQYAHLAKTSADMIDLNQAINSLN